MTALAAAVSSAAAAAGPTAGPSASATMAVSALVEPSCRLRVDPLRFDGATAAQPQREAEAAIAVGCTPDTGFAVAIDDGQHSAGGQRRMTTATGEYLAYEIYADAARSRRWGSGAGGAASGTAPADGRVQLTAYARITGREAMAGQYRDVVTVTVSF